MFIEPTITWVPSGFSGHMRFDTKIWFKKRMCRLAIHESRGLKHGSNRELKIGKLRKFAILVGMNILISIYR